MKYFKNLLFIIFLIPIFSFAQGNYKPGYIIKLNGDTVHGFVNYKEWGRNPEKIEFKSGSNGQTENLTTRDITAFAVSGLEYFKRFTVHVSQAPVEMADIKMGADTSYIDKEVFLKMLSTGNNITLYSYADDIKIRYYILDGSEAIPQELIYQVYYSPQSYGLVQTENKYRNQLEYLAQKYKAGNSKVEMEISTAAYQGDDLVKVVQAINGNKSSQFTPKSLLGTQWHAGVGIADNQLGFTGTIVYPSKSSILPMISAGFDVFPNKNTQRLSLRADLVLMEDKYSFSNGPFANGYSTSLNNLIQTTLSISPQIFYNLYSSKKINFFIDCGLSVNFAHYNNYNFTENYSNAASTTTPQFPELRSFWFSAPLKTGVTLNKKIEIYVCYVINPLITNNYVPYPGSLTTYQAGINYLFGVK